jgi:eukaryotic-like serine/threonine-protein kinase
MSIYTNCINRTCKGRENPKNSDECRKCGTSILLNQRFRILERIGKSSYAYEVFRAEDTKDNNKIVAIKTLVDSSQRSYEKFFFREKSILNFSNYDCLPKFIEEGKDPTRTEIPYFVMEFIEGKNLSQWLEAHTKLSDEGRAWDWLASITKTLAYLHDRERLHLDLKPDNIILKKNSHPDELVLIDFSTDGRVGTPGYIAPERESAQKNTPLVDFFSLGQTFVHLTTGCHPETFENGGNWAASTSFPSSPIIEVINWMREEDPVNRPQTAYQVLYAIDILSKPKSDGSPCTHEDAIDLIKNIRNGLKEDEELRLILQQSERQIQDRDASIEEINNRLYLQEKKYNTLEKEVDRYLRIIRGAIIGGIIALILAVLMSKLYVDSQNSLHALEKELKKPPLNGSIAGENRINVGKLISSGGQNLSAFGYDNLSDSVKQLKIDAIESFKEAEKSNAAELYNQAFINFKKVYEQTQNNKQVVDPEIPIYLNNAKARYLSIKNPNKKLYKIAVPCPVTKETGQHILLGVALKQQLLLNSYQNKNYSKPIENNIEDPENKLSFYLEIIVADDNNNKDTAKKIAEELVKDNKIITIVGHYGSEATLSALESYSEAGLAVVSPTTTVSEIPVKYRNVFNRTISSTDVEAEAWLNFLENQPFFKNPSLPILQIKVFYEYLKPVKTVSFSQDLFEQFKKKLSKKYDPKQYEISTFNLSDNDDSNLDKFISSIKPENTLVVLIPSSKISNQPGSFEKSMDILDKLQAQKYFEKITVIGSNPLFSATDVTPIRLKTWNNKLIVAVDWHFECNGKREFITHLNDFVGGQLDRRTAASYEAIQVLSHLFKTKENLDRQSIVTLLKEETTTVLSEVYKDNKEIRFDPRNGNRIGIKGRMIVTPQTTLSAEGKITDTKFKAVNNCNPQ